jgi:hypothetical protein
VGELLRELPPSYQSERVELTSQALELIARHSTTTFQHFREVIRLTALKPPALGDYSNVSHADARLLRDLSGERSQHADRCDLNRKCDDFGSIVRATIGWRRHC